jgi:riboflavin biosynthesis pyrimidine reductase
VLAGGHAHRLVVYVAPLALGSRGASALSFAGPDTIRDARRFHLSSVRQLGADVRLDYEALPQGWMPGKSALRPTEAH